MGEVLKINYYTCTKTITLTRVVQVGVPKVPHPDNASIQVIHGNAGPKKSLDLPAVEIDRDDAVHPFVIKRRKQSRPPPTESKVWQGMRYA